MYIVYIGGGLIGNIFAARVQPMCTLNRFQVTSLFTMNGGGIAHFFRNRELKYLFQSLRTIMLLLCVAHECLR